MDLGVVHVRLEVTVMFVVARPAAQRQAIQTQWKMCVELVVGMRVRNGQLLEVVPCVRGLEERRPYRPGLAARRLGEVEGQMRRRGILLSAMTRGGASSYVGYSPSRYTWVSAGQFHVCI